MATFPNANIVKIVVMGIVLCIASSCVDRGRLALFSSDSRLQYTGTGFKSKHTVERRLILRPVKDSRQQHEGMKVGGRTAKVKDVSYQRAMLPEFEDVLRRELQSFGAYRVVILSDQSPEPGDDVLTVDLQALFAEVKGFLVNFAGSAAQFQAVLTRDGKILFDETFTGTGNESERTAESGFFSTVVDALDSVTVVALRKTMLQLLEKMDGVITNEKPEALPSARAPKSRR